MGKRHNQWPRIACVILMMIVIAAISGWLCPAWAQNDSSKADSLYDEGAALYEAQDYDGAGEKFETALALYQELGIRDSEAWTMQYLGLVADNLGRYADAMDYYEQALALYRELGMEEDEALTIQNLGTAATNLGRYNEAVNYYEQALELFRALGMEEDEAYALRNLGIDATNLGQNSEALDYDQQALELFAFLLSGPK